MSFLDSNQLFSLFDEFQIKLTQFEKAKNQWEKEQNDMFEIITKLENEKKKQRKIKKKLLKRLKFLQVSFQETKLNENIQNKESEEKQNSVTNLFENISSHILVKKAREFLQNSYNQLGIKKQEINKQEKEKEKLKLNKKEEIQDSKKLTEQDLQTLQKDLQQILNISELEIDKFFNFSSEKIIYNESPSNKISFKSNQFQKVIDSMKLSQNKVSTFDNEALNSTTKKGIINFKKAVTLTNHLDSVRSVSWHSTEDILLTGSEDCTLKLWAFNKKMSHYISLNNSTNAEKPQKKIEPIYTFRGHTAPIYKVILDSAKGICISAGGDAIVRLWEFPGMEDNNEISAFENPIQSKLDAYIGHADAIWDLSIHPEKSCIISSSADGTIKFWDMEKMSPFIRDYLFPNIENLDNHVPTTVTFSKLDPNKIVAGYNSSSLVFFDVETGERICGYSSKEYGDEITEIGNKNRGNLPKINLARQINTLTTHSVIPLVIAGTEDRKINMYDFRAKNGIGTITGHLDAITGVSIDPSGLYFATSSHDCHLRIWDIRTRTFVQDFFTSRRKNDEGVHCVEFHPIVPMIATGAADSLIQIFA
ncbi:striatin [Anaeramoeba ignava]|uniref:Striatin n=1 Tax=Anaeramoeba ignava TaxID=1746090 RepID=A0A9Q0RFP3_ANAIG|nr:striatin [Anaeramoeba ignava]